MLGKTEIFLDYNQLLLGLTPRKFEKIILKDTEVLKEEKLRGYTRAKNAGIGPPFAFKEEGDQTHVFRLMGYKYLDVIKDEKAPLKVLEMYKN